MNHPCLAHNALFALTLTLLPVKGEQEPSRRPEIGIALEGGGALVLAHIGVLEWLEENHIPIDYGIYAMGLRANEIREFVIILDWMEILSPCPPIEILAWTDFLITRMLAPGSPAPQPAG